MNMRHYVPFSPVLVTDSWVATLEAHFQDMQAYFTLFKKIEARLCSSFWLSRSFCLSSRRILHTALFVATGCLRFLDEDHAPNSGRLKPESLRLLCAHFSASLAALIRCFSELSLAHPLRRWLTLRPVKHLFWQTLTLYSDLFVEMNRWIDALFPLA